MSAAAVVTHYPVSNAPFPNATLSAEEREQLILAHVPQVRHIARRLRQRLPESVSIEDLVSTGVIGLIAAIDEDLALGGLDESADQLEQRRLARTGRSKECQELAAVDAEFSRLQRGGRAIPFAQALDEQFRWHLTGWGRGHRHRNLSVSYASSQLLKRSLTAERFALHQSSLATVICLRFAGEVGNASARAAGIVL